jgi:hypothetical protein
MPETLQVALLKERLPAQIACSVRLVPGFSCSPFRRLAAAEGIDVDVVNLPLAA